MRIWLINPPEDQSNSTGMFSIIRNLFYNSPPLGLAYLAAVLEMDGHKVSITDCPVENVFLNDLIKKAQEISPDLVGFTSTTTFFSHALSGAKLIKSVFPDIPICIGGPHFNANPELLVENDCFDFGVIGEGEDTIRDVAGSLEKKCQVKDVPGVVTAGKDALLFAPARALIENLDSIPFPARHLLPILKYKPMPNDQNRAPKTSMISSRGCPFKCVFCDKSTFGGVYRTLSAGRILEEMNSLKSDFGINEVAFVDSSFTPNRQRITDFLDEIEKCPVDMAWTCSFRANVVDRATLVRMKKAGCWRLRVAMESGNDEILRKIRKGITKEQFIKTVKAAHEVGLQVKAFFMVGHFGETKETINESIEFAKSLPLKDITVQINTPLKGAPQYKDAEKHGAILENDPGKYNFFQPVFVPKGFTAKEILDSQKIFYRRFYLRPSLIWMHIKQIRSFSDLRKYLGALPLLLNIFFFRRNAG